MAKRKRGGAKHMSAGGKCSPGYDVKVAGHCRKSKGGTTPIANRKAKRAAAKAGEKRRKKKK